MGCSTVCPPRGTLEVSRIESLGGLAPSQLKGKLGLEAADNPGP
jgi:hypothetical protein